MACCICPLFGLSEIFPILARLFPEEGLMRVPKDFPISTSDMREVGDSLLPVYWALLYNSYFWSFEWG